MVHMLYKKAKKRRVKKFFPGCNERRIRVLARAWKKVQKKFVKGIAEPKKGAMFAPAKTAMSD